MSIDVNKANFVPNVAPESNANVRADFDATARVDPSPNPVAGDPILATLLGTTLSISFYAVVLTVQWAPLQRYFSGHPVAVGATILFWFAVGVLIAKWLGIVTQANQLSAIRDEDLLPTPADETPAENWLANNDAGHVARGWLSDLAGLPSEIRKSHLVRRLHELLTRQSQRGTTKHLADDLRELSARDADAAHDSLGLVRIIVWAIPMMGFLGTVIGITQTLGGLDFSNGTAAVDSLKSGLYVAFDTTALGLVLSVVAIFLQFPIERSEQRLLAEIDSRVGSLVSASLPTSEASDNQTALIADLCQGVQAAVAESLENQTRLWRESIDEAREHWQSVHEANQNTIAVAFEKTLVPALLGHVGALDESAQIAIDRIERQSKQWNEQITYHSNSFTSQQHALVNQYSALAEAHERTDAILTMQQTLDANLQRLTETNAAIDRGVSAAAGDSMANAMRILARAVDVLSVRLTEQGPGPNELVGKTESRDDTSSRRAA